MCKNNCNSSSSRNDCNNLGPFVATDINCINSEIGNGRENLGGSIIPFSSGIQSVVENILGNNLASLIGLVLL